MKYLVAIALLVVVFGLIECQNSEPKPQGRQRGRGNRIGGPNGVGNGVGNGFGFGIGFGNGNGFRNGRGRNRNNNREVNFTTIAQRVLQSLISFANSRLQSIEGRNETIYANERQSIQQFIGIITNLINALKESSNGPVKGGNNSTVTTGQPINPGTVNTTVVTNGQKVIVPAGGDPPIRVTPAPIRRV